MSNSPQDCPQLGNPPLRSLLGLFFLGGSGGGGSGHYQDANVQRAVEDRRRRTIDSGTDLLAAGVVIGSTATTFLADVQLNINQHYSCSVEVGGLLRRRISEARLRAAAELEFSTARMLMFRALIIEVNRIMGYPVYEHTTKEQANEAVRDARGRLNVGGGYLQQLRRCGWRGQLARVRRFLSHTEDTGFGLCDLQDAFDDALTQLESINLAFDFDMFAAESMPPSSGSKQLSIRQILENLHAIVKRAIRKPLSEDCSPDNAHIEYLILVLSLRSELLSEPSVPSVARWRSYLHVLEGWMLYLRAKDALLNKDLVLASCLSKAARTHLKLARRQSWGAWKLCLLTPIRWFGGRPVTRALNAFGPLPSWRQRQTSARQLAARLHRLESILCV